MFWQFCQLLSLSALYTLRRQIQRAKVPSDSDSELEFSNMRQLMNYPVLLSVLTLAGLWAFALIGTSVRGRKKQDDDSDHAAYGMVLSATLTLLGLLIGFSFSMAIGRYDQRKNYEEEEANAIGTEYARAGLLPGPSQSKLQAQLVQYLDLRIKR